ncbi:hypothetical protein SODALDRAFT_356474 [Sodiomyces alkalinus F11]|uniref:Uncharacterized protein n=1 Tax=Sodiomyces alkalinus (strain CBS 110278 / VKM F-3762 / F11) TaxID=1314773 RepID=A0A3N2Q1J8_SODAK|nr:hypothetical protein SODALDRAFT_356474 [Sodiomyces alkalinus F11]ROT40485.1 hypothetical protein SODALDRAFT_356474 [Sodiomyces alkalinus F11]
MAKRRMEVDHTTYTSATFEIEYSNALANCATEDVALGIHLALLHKHHILHGTSYVIHLGRQQRLTEETTPSTPLPPSPSRKFYISSSWSPDIQLTSLLEGRANVGSTIHMENPGFFTYQQHSRLVYIREDAHSSYVRGCASSLHINPARTTNSRCLFLRLFIPVPAYIGDGLGSFVPSRPSIRSMWPSIRPAANAVNDTHGCSG